MEIIRLRTTPKIHTLPSETMPPGGKDLDLRPILVPYLPLEPEFASRGSEAGGELPPGQPIGGHDGANFPWRRRSRIKIKAQDEVLSFFRSGVCPSDRQAYVPRLDNRRSVDLLHLRS